MPSLHLSSLVGSTGLLPFLTGWELVEERGPTRRHFRAQQGGLYTFAPGGEPLRYELPLAFVDSAVRATLNAWWADGRQVLLTLAASDSPRSVLFRIANGQRPIGGRIAPLADRFAGSLLLLEDGAVGKRPGGPFILDDATWGKLDQTYNVLT